MLGWLEVLHICLKSSLKYEDEIYLRGLSFAICKYDRSWSSLIMLTIGNLGIVMLEFVPDTSMIPFCVGVVI